MTAAPAILADETATPAGHNQPPDDETEDIIDAFTAILTIDRGPTVPCHITTAFNKARIFRGIGQASPDPLLVDLFGFQDGHLPQMTNLFCSDMGTLLEKLVNYIFARMRPNVVDISQETMNRLHARYSAMAAASPEDKFPLWKNGDFLLGDDTMVETKYRYNSKDKKHKQINVARAYRKIGLTPVLLHLSSEFRDKADFVKAGWDVKSGRDAVRYINDHTGLDFEEILRRVSQQPAVHARIEQGHRTMIDTMKHEAERDFRYGVQDVQDHILAILANDPPLLRRFAEKHVQKRPGPVIDPEILSRHAEQVSNAEISEIGTETLDNAFETLDTHTRKEFLVNALKKLGDNDKLDVFSRT